MTDIYKVSVTGPGINIEREIDKGLAEKVFMAVVTGTFLPQQDNGQFKRATPKPGAPDQPLLEDYGDSLANFFGAADAKKVPQKIAAIGAFLKNHRNTMTFDKDALESAFEEAAESVPKNLSRDLKNTVRLGWIAAKLGEKGVYYITGPGSKAVVDRFVGVSTKASRTTRSKRKAPKAAKKAT